MKYGKMMKGIGVAALALTVVSSCIVGGTQAKYTTTATGQGSAIVAKWAPSFTSGGSEFTDSTTISLKDTDVTADKVAADRIAPGTSGSFSIEVGRGDTEVGFTYALTISNVNNMPTNLKFYTEDDTELTAVDNVYNLTPADAGNPTKYTIAANASATKTVTVKWKWPYEAGEPDKTANDTADSTDGTNAATMTFDINITATQVATTTS